MDTVQTPETISIDRTDTIVTICGEIDAHTAPQARDAGNAVLTECGTLRFDLRGVEFIDSSGLGVLVALTSTARETGGDVVIVAPSRPVVRLLQISGLEGHLTVHPT